MTPTEQQMQEFKDFWQTHINKVLPKDFYTDEDWLRVYNNYTAHHQHCLMKQVGNDLIDFLEAHTKWMALGEEGMPPNPRFERVKFCKQIISELRKLAALQERLKAEQDYSMMMKEQFESVHTQLTASQERCKELEGKLSECQQHVRDKYIE